MLVVELVGLLHLALSWVLKVEWNFLVIINIAMKVVHWLYAHDTHLGVQCVGISLFPSIHR